MQFKDGQIAQGTDVSPAFHQGLNALCVYALLNSGQAVRDPRLLPTSDFMRRLIDNMKFHPMATDRDRPQSPVVYARSLRAAALALYTRPEDMDELRDDVQWLVDASVEGAYSYDDRLGYRVIADDSGNHPGRAGQSPRGSPVSPRDTAPKGTSPGSPADKPPVVRTSPGGETITWRLRTRPPTRELLKISFRPPVYRLPPLRPTPPVFRPPPGAKTSPPPAGGGRKISIPPAAPPNYPPQELPEKNGPSYGTIPIRSTASSA